MGACCETGVRRGGPGNPRPEDLNYFRSEFENSFTTNQIHFEPAVDNWEQIVSFDDLLTFILSQKGRDAINYLKEKLPQKHIFFESFRGKIGIDFELGEDQIVSTEMWSPLLFCVAQKQLELLKFFISECKCNAELCLKEPLYENEEDGGKNEGAEKEWNSSIALLLAANNYDIPMLDYLWNELYYLWELEDLERIIEYCH